MVDKDIPGLRNFHQQFLEKTKTLQYEGGLFDFFHDYKYANLSLHHSIFNFRNTTANKSAEEFIQFMLENISNELAEKAALDTKQQSRSYLWYQLRYGRITASHLYEAARCKTVDGVLVEKILGASKPFQSEAMQRGLTLEMKVLKLVAQRKRIAINRCGLIVKKEYPIFGASPDGLSDNSCVEIKCPAKATTVKNYVENGVVKRRYYFQMQLQMMLTGKSNALFCVASPNFEQEKQIDIYTVPFNEDECKEMMSVAENFWKMHIFPNLFK